MKSKTFVFSSIATVVFAVLTFVVTTNREMSKLSYSSSQKFPAIYGPIQNFEFTTQNGEKLGLQNLKGKPWIADFIFTRCAGICPLMTSKMKGLQEKLSGQTAVRFVSFSVDPEYDTPEILLAYANRFEADPEKWFFLTGNKEEIHRLSRESFKLAAAEIPVQEREQMDQGMLHSSKFVLVDGTGQIRGFYESSESKQLDQLIKDATSLI